MIYGLTRVRRRVRHSEGDASLPKLAVIVAARDEEEQLPVLIEALSAQDYPADLVSFWLVDDDSRDGTFLVAEKAAKRDPRFHALRSDGSLPIPSPKKRALHTGILQADAEWIVTTDADCTPPPSWLRGLAAFMLPENGAVVGYAPLTGGRSPLEFLAMGESWSAAALAAAGIGLDYPFTAFGRNFAFRRDVYLDLGGYGAGGAYASGDDDLFLQSIAARTNWRIAFAADPRAVVPSLVNPGGRVLSAKARHLSVGTHYAPGWILLGGIGSLLFMGLALV
ncbi:MAG TPA: glycosyltransferase, partial [Bacteroidetes bacterium]|nr:glycosyltransferase [Bacteroidota bacterium]